MAYASREGIDAKFRSATVAKWADPDNAQSAGLIAARIASAVAAADAEVDAELRDTHYRKPFVTASGATPLVIADIANALAGCWLKDAHGQDTFDEQGAPLDSLAYHRRKAYETLAKIKSGQIILDAI